MREEEESVNSGGIEEDEAVESTEDTVDTSFLNSFL